MKKNKNVHDINNFIERLRIMLDIVRNEKFDQISKQELIEDLDTTLKDIKKKFEQILQ